MIVTEATWYVVRNTRGVTGFVGSGTDPIPLTEDEIRIREVSWRIHTSKGIRP